MTEKLSIQWSYDQLEALVLEQKPRVAVFDCDGTLWSGDSGSGFLKWSLDEGLLSRSTSDWIDARYRAYLAGQVSEETICGEMVQIYADLRDQELRAAAAHYVTQFVTPRIFEEMDRLVAALRKEGVELWAVSSTNKWVVSEGVRYFGIPEQRVLAAEVAVNKCIISSELVRVPTGPGKAAALRNVGLVRPDVVFGNSLHDLAMLDLARYAYPINPSPTLLAAAAERGWGHFIPATAEGEKSSVAGE